MALIENSNPKGTSDGYFRLFGIKALANLITKIHSTVISSGTELEKIILSKVNCIDDLDSFLTLDTAPIGIFVASKKAIKKSQLIDSAGQEPDFLIFKTNAKKKECIILELKDGHVFDTKKALSEKTYLENFLKKNAHKFPFIFRYYMCCFNQNDINEIHKGFKSKLSKNELMTGSDFCKLLNIDYENIQKDRTKDNEKNVMYFLKELLKIDEIKEKIKKIM